MDKPTLAERQLNVQIEDLDGYQRRREELRYYTIESLEPVFSEIVRHLLFNESISCDLEAAQTLAAVSLSLDQTYNEKIEETQEEIDRLRQVVDAHYLSRRDYEEYEKQEAERSEA